MYKRFVKSLLDFVFATILLFLLSPITALIVVLYSFYPKMLFFQTRIGKANKSFLLIKIRTLYPENPKLNRIGVFLRKTGLDELPQLINILKGELSFIGPRPLLPEYLPLYTTKQLLRHTVKPGLSGLAQIKGFNNVSWESKFRLDLIYVKHLSFTLDTYILFQTFKQLLTLQRFKVEKKSVADAFTGTH